MCGFVILLAKPAVDLVLQKFLKQLSFQVEAGE